MTEHSFNKFVEQLLCAKHPVLATKDRALGKTDAVPTLMNYSLVTQRALGHQEGFLQQESVYGRLQ